MNSIAYARKLGDEIADIEAAMKRLGTAIVEARNMHKRLTHGRASNHVDDALGLLMDGHDLMSRAISTIEDDMPASRLETPAR